MQRAEGRVWEGDSEFSHSGRVRALRAGTVVEFLLQRRVVRGVLQRSFPILLGGGIVAYGVLHVTEVFEDSDGKGRCVERGPEMAVGRFQIAPLKVDPSEGVKSEWVFGRAVDGAARQLERFVQLRFTDGQAIGTGPENDGMVGA